MMKKMQGIVDPISLTLLIVLGIATVGTIVDKNATDKAQLAHDAQPQTEQITPSKDMNKS